MTLSFPSLWLQFTHTHIVGRNVIIPNTNNTNVLRWAFRLGFFLRFFLYVKFIFVFFFFATRIPLRQDTTHTIYFSSVMRNDNAVTILTKNYTSYSLFFLCLRSSLPLISCCKGLKDQRSAFALISFLFNSVFPTLRSQLDKWFSTLAGKESKNYFSFFLSHCRSLSKSHDFNEHLNIFDAHTQRCGSNPVQAIYCSVLF